MKQTHKLFFTLIMLGFAIYCKAQCNATITANGPTIFCTSDTSRTVTLTAQFDGTNWVQKTDFAGSPRWGAAGFSIGSKVYVGTGNDAIFGARDDFWEFDPTTNVWTQIASFTGGARSSASAFSIGNKGYLGLGFYGTFSFHNDFWEYDPIANNWTQKSNFGGTGRSVAVSFVINNKAYVGTGFDGTRANDFWEYEPTNDTWTRKADFGGVGRSGATGFSASNKGYIGLGYSYNGATPIDFWEYQPLTDTWIEKAYFPDGSRNLAAGFGIGNKGYIVTGYSNTGYSNKSWEYDTNLDRWRQLVDYGGIQRDCAVAITCNNKGYVGLGKDAAGNLSDFWEYDPSVNYLWSTGETTDSIVVDTTGNYSVTITNSAGCVASASQLVEKNFKPVINSTSFTNVSCYGLGNGAASVNVIGGNPTYSYYWQPIGGYANSTTTLGPGTYTCYVNDIKDCAASAVFSITEPSYSGSTQAFTLFTGDSIVVGPYVHTTTGEYTDTLTNVTGCDSIIKTSVVFISASITSTSPFEVCSPDSIKLTANLVGLDWMPKSNTIGSGRFGAVAFSIGNKGYMGTGYDAIGYTNDFWEYNPSNDIWTQKADFAGAARYNAVAFTIGNKGYIGTGYDVVNNRSNDFWEYDPTLNSWTQKANFGGTPRYEAAGFSIGNKGYIGTGYDGDSCRTDFWEYNPLIDVWTRKADFACVPRQGAVGFSLAGEGFIGCGHYGNVNGMFLRNDIWEYNPTLDIWFETSVYPGSIGMYQSVFTINDKAYVGLGYGPAGYSKDFWEFDLNNNEWTRLADFRGTGRSLAFGLSISNKGYFGTGYDGLSGNTSVTKDFWEYNPELDYLWSTGDTTESIVVHTSGIYSVTLANFTGLNASTSQTVTINPSPSLSVVSLNDAICNGSATGNVTMVATDGTPSYSYAWQPNGGSSSIASNLTVGSYTCNVIDANNCSATETVDILEPSYIGSSQSYTLCPGETASVGIHTYSSAGVYRDTLVAFSGCDSIITTIINYLPIDVTTSVSNNVITVNTASATYQWIDCDTNIPIPGATTQSYSVNVNGNYAVVVTVNNCSDTSTCVNANSVGLISSSSVTLGKIYPNPSKGIYTVDIKEAAEIIITNTLGEIIVYQQLEAGRKTISIENMANGIYFATIKCQNTQQIIKLIKNN